MQKIVVNASIMNGMAKLLRKEDNSQCLVEQERYHELLKPGETYNRNRYRRQLINLHHALLEQRPQWDTG